MKDPKLETQLRLLSLELESWKKLHNFITYALDKTKPIISADQERQFTDLRATLLQETEHVFNELSLVAELSGKALSVLQRTVSLRAVRDLASDETRRLEADWNFVFTKLGLAQGQLKATRKELMAKRSWTDFFVHLFPRRLAAQ